MRLPINERNRICVITAILLTGGSDNLLLQTYSRFLNAGYQVSLYVVYPPPVYGKADNFQKFFEKKGIKVINGPFWIKPLLLAVGIIISSPVVFIYIFLSLFRWDRIEAFYLYVRQRIDKKILDLFDILMFLRISYDHYFQKYALISGYHIAVTHLLHMLKIWLKIPVCYTEISSPYWHRLANQNGQSGRDLNSLNSIVVPSLEIGNELQQYFGVDLKSEVIPFYVKLPNYDYSPPNQSAKSFGIIARLSPEKNLDILIKILPAVRKKVPNAKLILIGTGPSETDLKMLAINEGVQDSVEFIPRFNTIEEVIDCVDIVTLISDVEGMPLTLLESLYYGKPILATPVGSIPSLVLNGFNGWVINKNDPDVIVNRLLEIMTDRDLFYQLSENSRKLYYEKFDPDVVFSQLYHVFRDLINNN